MHLARSLSGVDTHAQAHVAAVLDHLGRLQGTLTVPPTRAGHQQLLGWASGHGQLVRAGVEGTAPTVLACATLLATAGDNPNRLHSEAALAALCAARPV